MKSSVKEQAHSQKSITVKVTMTEMSDFWSRAIHKLKHKAKIAGFRDGRAPDEVVVKHVGQQTVLAEALDMALSDTYFLALQEHKLSPVAHPKIEVKKQVAVDHPSKSEEIALEYTAQVSVVPEVKILGLSKIRVEEKEVLAPTEEEIQKVIDYLRRQKAIMKEVKRPAKMGDWCDIAYEGSVDGVKKEQMKNEHHPLIIGEAKLIPGFEEGLVGMQPGENKALNLKFPKEYHATDVAGKSAVFAVKMLELKEVILPEFDATFTKDFGYAEPKEMREAITKNLATEKKQEVANDLREAVLKQLESRIKADIPPIMFEQEVDRLLADLKKKVEDQKLPWENYLQQIKRTEEELTKEFRPQAEKNVRLGLALGVIVKEQGLKVDNEHQAVTTAVDWLVRLATGKVEAKEVK